MPFCNHLIVWSYCHLQLPRISYFPIFSSYLLSYCDQYGILSNNFLKRYLLVLQSKILFSFNAIVFYIFLAVSCISRFSFMCNILFTVFIVIVVASVGFFLLFSSPVSFVLLLFSVAFIFSISLDFTLSEFVSNWLSVFLFWKR